ncbi:MAG: ABC transporter ATP-binding protein [Candidatus Woesearchaeota archaeon]|nr:ABC transporter ATP-binding protein [Candidatus Woesearchaeota archaeon]
MVDLKEGVKRVISPYKSLFGIKDVEEEKSEEVIERVVQSIEKEKSEEQKQAITKPYSFDKEDVIQFIGVTKRFGNNLVLNNISLGIPEGKILGLIGISGSGKSTILKLLIGFYRPNKGQILYNGKSIFKNSKDIRRTFGFSTQDNCFYGKLTVEENIRYFGELYGLTRQFIDNHIEEVLNLVQLNYVKDKLAENLSTGMQRRVDLACALIHDPKILILDEPTEDLDRMLRKEMLNLIHQINKRGTTVIITSHLLWEIEHLCDKIAIIHDTNIIEVGSPADIRNRYFKYDEIHLELASDNYDKIIRSFNKKDIKNIVRRHHRIIIYTSNPEKIIHSILDIAKKKKEKINHIELRKPNLDEIFEYLTKK